MGSISNKKQQQKSRHLSANTTPSASDPLPSVRAVPSGDAPASAPGPLAPLLASNLSPPPVATSSSATVENQIQFAVVYMEPSLEFQYEEEGEMPAKLAVVDAVSIATESFSSALGVSNMEFLVYPSFPTDFGHRDMTLREWNALGKDPFVALGPKDQSTGFHPLLEASRAEVKEVRQYNSDLIETGLKDLGLIRTASAPCSGCKYLRNVVASLKSHNDVLQHKVDILQHKVDILQQQNVSLGEEKEKMRKVRRRILVEQAQEKAVRELGFTLADVRTWQSFFTDHAQKLREDLGVSKELHRLLLYDKGKLNRTVHHSGELELAEAITSMPESPSKVQFEEAFKYVFGFSAARALED